jgi:hypothetical protein
MYRMDRWRSNTWCVLESLNFLNIGSFPLELKSTYCRHSLGAFIFMNIIKKGQETRKI